MIHLACRTDFSFMRGYGNPESFFDRAAMLGHEAFGIADYCSTWGHIPFMKHQSDVRLIYGAQVPVVMTLDKDPRHALVALLAKNERGLHTLYDLMSRATEQMYYRPRLVWGQLKAVQKDVVTILIDGRIEDIDKIEEFGYVGLGPHSPEYLRDNAASMKSVALTPVAYPTTADKQAYDLLQAISPHHKLGEVVNEASTHMMREDEFRAMWPDVPDALIETAKEISDACRPKLQRATNITPPKKHTLAELCHMGGKQRGIDLSDAHPNEYLDRLNYELGIIEEKGIGDYFHFVTDLVVWAKNQGMYVGPARGSSGGSLVCYLLRITELDPLRFGTMFERFIDITRSDWPDIDVDFPDTKRDLVFEYLRDTYGEDKVARLGTVSKFGGKSAINDTGKAYKISWDLIRGLSAQIGEPIFGKQPPLAPAFNTNDEAKKILEQEPALRDALLIEGRPRHHGVHAAGVVVTNEPVRHFGMVDKHGVIAIDLDGAEAVNLMKMDALGLRTLSVIEDCCAQVGINPQSLYDLSWNDQKVFDVFNKDELTGVFQFEGTTVRGLMKEMQVTEFNDLSALVSLARPGPLVGGAAENWIKRRSGKIEWDYAHPAFADPLGETYGTIVYQEQAMKIVQMIGGFPIEDVNAFRKAIGKKIPEKLRAYRDQWMKGAGETLGEELASKTWEEMEEFGSYAFNKSHAVAYAMLAYVTAHLKAYHPLEFAVAQLRNAADEDQTKALLRELDAEGYSWVAFDPDRSEVSWRVIDNVLYGGFTSVKGVGSKTANKFIEARAADPENWMDGLTDAQRKKLTTEFNTPWADLNRFGKQYAHLYEDPEKYNIEGPVLRIRDIPGQKGSYCFLGTLKRKYVKDKGSGNFMNLFFEDDTGEVGSTINRFKFVSLAEPLLAEGAKPEGKDYLIRGNVINDDGRVWIFIDKMKELNDD